MAKTRNKSGLEKPRSGDIPLATGFSRWFGNSGRVQVPEARQTSIAPPALIQAHRFVPPAKAGGYKNVAATRLRWFTTALLGSFLITPIVSGQVYKEDLQVSHPAIRYFQTPAHDAFGKLNLDGPEATVDFLGFLLKKLGLNTDSQMLVFSKTSFQAPKISPDNPRAIYFNDDIAVGYVRGSDSLEVAALDPLQGPIFYEVRTDKSGKREAIRNSVCLRCHQGPNTFGVPGLYIGSVIPSPSGAPLRDDTAIVTDHRTEFKDRWGGWYVNAKRGEQLDRANAVALNPAQPDELVRESQQNLTTLIGKFNPSGYLAQTSDIIALMTFEHQTQMINYITRVGWQARMGKQPDVDELVSYMLFAKEAPLKEPLEGVSTFTKTFAERGPRDRKGRSLRDFDLQNRLFRYPLSYVIYSPSFDALPDTVRDAIYSRLYEILTGKDQNPDYATLSAADRRAVLEILRDTKPNLPEYWRKDEPLIINR